MQGIAEANFPQIEQQMGIALPLIDVFGKKYSFRYRFWINNASRMYLVEGTQDLQRRFRLSVGDVLMFAKHLDSNTYYVCGRKGCPGETSRRPPTKRPDGSNQSSKRIKSERNGTKVAQTVQNHPESISVQKVDEIKSAIKVVQKDATLPPKESDDALNKAKRIKPTKPSMPSPPSLGGVVPGTKSHTGIGAATKVHHNQQESNESWNPTSLPPRLDGVFRAVANQSGALTPQTDGVVPQYGMWSAKATLGGEPFEAFFDTEQRAVAAYEAVRQS